MLLLLLERWVKYRDACREVSWPFLKVHGDMVNLPVPTPIAVTINGVKSPLARLILGLESK